MPATMCCVVLLHKQSSAACQRAHKVTMVRMFSTIGMMRMFGTNGMVRMFSTTGQSQNAALIECSNDSDQIGRLGGVC